MKRLPAVLLIVLLVAALAPNALATNGTNLIGVGPISRSMGGVGVAAPQDAISAIFANPAAMCFGPYCPGAEANFDGTFFDPKVSGKIVNNGVLAPYPNGTYTGDSQMRPFVVPAVAVTSPITPTLRFGIGAYGVSGMGVDYKDEDPAFNNMYTKLEVMKFAPNFAYQVSPNFSLGASLSVGYQNLDLAKGGAHDYALGLQVGTLYHAGIFNFGASYITPQKVKHENVTDFPTNAAPQGDGIPDDLELESPQVFVFGVAAEPSTSLLVELNVKWLNWEDATGFDAFDWENQWVYALGVQYKPTADLALRAGFNYAEHPIKEHQGFNPAGTTNVQGIDVNNVGYEYFRIIGFPALVEKHLTLGVGYNLTENLILNLSYMHAFEETLREASAGDAIILESSLEENSYSFGLTWRF